MIHDIPDPYTSTFAGDPDQRSYVNSAFRDARRILRLPDSAIQELQVRKSGLRTFVIEGARVSGYHGASKRFVCWSHTANDCGHIRRVLRFMEGK